MRNCLWKNPSLRFMSCFLGIGAVFGLGLATPAVAEVIVNVNNAGSTTLHEVSVLPGDQFEVDVSYGTDDGGGLITMYFRANMPGILEVLEGAWREPWTGSIPLGGIDPLSAPFGGAVPLQAVPTGPTLAMFSIGVDTTAAPGDYLLNTDGIRGSSTINSMDIFYGQPGPDFLVRVIPEPGMAAMMFCVLSLGLWRRH